MWMTKHLHYQCSRHLIMSLNIYLTKNNSIAENDEFLVADQGGKIRYFIDNIYHLWGKIRYLRGNVCYHKGGIR